MLLKYLNQLDDAVRQMRAHPGDEEKARCARCVEVLERYLDGQAEPVRRRGHEIMGRLLPDSIAASLRRSSSHAARSEVSRSL